MAKQNRGEGETQSHPAPIRHREPYGWGSRFIFVACTLLGALLGYAFGIEGFLFLTTSGVLSEAILGYGHRPRIQRSVSAPPIPPRQVQTHAPTAAHQATVRSQSKRIRNTVRSAIFAVVVLIVALIIAGVADPEGDRPIWRVLKILNQWSRNTPPVQLENIHNDISQQADNDRAFERERERVGEWSKNVGSARQTLIDLKNAGFIKSLDVDSRILRVSTVQWLPLEVEEKRKITMAAAYYVSGSVIGNNSYHPSSIQVLGDRSDEILADYTVREFGGDARVHR